jgi:hypothetical protein
MVVWTASVVPRTMVLLYAAVVAELIMLDAVLIVLDVVVDVDE